MKTLTAPQTYDEVLQAYRALLEDKPGKGLKIDGNTVAVMVGGQLFGAYLNHAGHVDLDDAFDFDRSAWDDDNACWECDDGALETADSINDPEYVDFVVPRPAKYLMNPATGSVDTEESWLAEMPSWEGDQQEQFDQLIEVRLASGEAVPEDFNPSHSDKYEWVEVE